jgi:tetratricopeptide (TPR) repeat protein
MRLLRAAFLSCGTAILLGGVIWAPLVLGQEPATKTAGAVVPAASLSLDEKNDAAGVEMQAIQDGIKAYQDKNFQAAAVRFEAATATHAVTMPTAHAYAWLARTYLHLGRVPEAEEAARKATDLDKELANAQTAMAEVYFREGRMAEAQELLVSLLKSKNIMQRTYLCLAKIHRAAANYKTARTLIELAHKNDPKDPDIDEFWLFSMTPQERMEEWKKRLAEGRFEDNEERQFLAAGVAVLEDQKKNENRSCKLVNKLSTTQTKLQPHMLDPKRMSGYTLGVKVNGVNASLLLDTGAGGILVNTRIAEKAGLEKVADQPIGGIGDKGAAQGYVAYADRLQVGELEFQNCYIDVVDKKRSLDEDGLIGADVFGSYLVDIDFPNARLKLSQLPPYPDQAAEHPSLQSEQTTRSNLHDRWIPPEYKGFEGVLRFGHTLLLPVRLNKAPSRLFMLDTGAWDNTVTPAAAQEATKIHQEADIKVKGLNGDVKTVYTTGEILLTFGRFQQRRSDMVAFDLSNVSDHVGTEISGALGFAMLDLLDIKLDYRDNLVDFQYDPNRIH